MPSKKRSIEHRLSGLESASGVNAGFTPDERERLERALENPSSVRDSDVLIRRACRLGFGGGQCSLATALEQAITESGGPV